MDIHNESSMMCVLIKQKSPPQRLSPSLKEFSPEKKERKQHSTDQTKVPQMQTHRKNDWGVTLEKKKIDPNCPNISHSISVDQKYLICSIRPRKKLFS